MLTISGRWWRRLRLLAIAGIAIGIAIPAVKVPLDAFQADSEVFNRQVGWANILSLSVAALGLVLILAEKTGNIIGVREDTEIVAKLIASKIRRRTARTLAQLLSTDGLDSRSAPFQVELKEAVKGTSHSDVVNRVELGEFFLGRTNGRMVLLGAPGSGKSVLMLQLAEQLVEMIDRLNQVPIVYSLASWDSLNVELEDWLIEQTADEFGLRKGVARDLVQDGRILPLLDGLDEMGTTGETRRAMRAVERVNDYIAVTPQCRVVITSRDSKLYGRLAGRIRGATTIAIVPLGETRIEEQIRAYCCNHERFADWEPVFKSLRSRRAAPVREVLGTPWRLTTAVTYFMGGGDPGEVLPQKGEALKGSTGSQVLYRERVRDLLMDSFIHSRISSDSARGEQSSKVAALVTIAGRINQADQGEDSLR